MVDDAAALDPLVSSATDDLAIAHQDGADGNASFARTESRFFDGGFEELVDAATLPLRHFAALELSQLRNSG